MVAKTLWNYGKRVELSEQCGTSTLVIHHECVTSIWLLVELALPKGSLYNYVDQIFPLLTTTNLPFLLTLLRELMYCYSVAKQQLGQCKIPSDGVPITVR